MNEKVLINGKVYRFIKTITDICNNRIMRRLPESWLMKQPKPQHFLTKHDRHLPSSSDSSISNVIWHVRHIEFSRVARKEKQQKTVITYEYLLAV